MIRPPNNDAIKFWLAEQVRQARLHKARQALKGTQLARDLPAMSEARLLEIARNLENPHRLMANLLVVFNQWRRRRQIRRFA